MKLIIFILMVISSLPGLSQNMNNQRLESLLSQESDSVVGVEGRWQVSYKELTMMVITDEANDRMRIVAPIAKIDEMDKDLLLDCLAANFHTALDVKYAVSNDVMWSVFIHPLSPLSSEEVISAMSQVYYAVATFGTTYSSTPLLFGGGSNSEENTKPIPKLKKT